MGIDNIKMAYPPRRVRHIADADAQPRRRRALSPAETLGAAARPAEAVS